ncbi:LpxL/LpxP family Kdo(2)-lipid IV(A) lauroyl/palmitoleoyl acyltransferase [Gilvimarinus polysaccharolyticus]|uniref:LpxL/LpxP family Kdo(2)-lipid IV(A) lauroyl/palmitoleoyl acyltransferase n=1 Tax=Gilvimarinus polysaccharolyticus TaxID=863921 RepID=UPI0006730D3F|nr:LpxL/LpxP family Kdo(2)-lipid IV(A) lauroyl/palmitoleoyl acyltransferase [Gilvimarinus polysaccharolyticus]
MSRTRFSASLLKPRYWLHWLGAGLWFLLAHLPYVWQMWVARKLAPLLYLNKKRINYARVNIARCFPEKSATERELLLKSNTESMMAAVFETGIGWFWSSKRLRKLHSIEGVEHIHQAERDGVGVLLLTTHFSTLDIGSAFLGCNIEFDGLYRPHGNKVYDYLQRKGRESYCVTGEAIPRDNIRAMIAKLRKGRAVWYAPDRDLGEKNSVFVNFFGVPAATVTATSKIVKLGRARVIPFTQVRLNDGSGYKLTIHPPLDGFPSGDDIADTQRISDFMAEQIAKCPEQYFWAQPRFKTRPPGEPDFYR